jgi:hypothetical protein
MEEEKKEMNMNRRGLQSRVAGQRGEEGAREQRPRECVKEKTCVRETMGMERLVITDEEDQKEKEKRTSEETLNPHDGEQYRELSATSCFY